MAQMLSIAPIDEPISLAEAKRHLRVEYDFTADDVYIEGLITRVRDTAEAISLHALTPQTWKLYLDEWPDGNQVEIPRPPLSEVSSITYIPETGDPESPETLAESVYYVDVNRVPGRVVLKPNQSWPSEALYPAGAICITFVCGYTAPQDIPQKARQAMFLLLGEWYENREPLTLGQGANVAQLPRGVDALLWDLRAQAVSW